MTGVQTCALPIPDNDDLLRLLVGYWSWRNYREMADYRPGIKKIARDHDGRLRAWFPGGGDEALPYPWVHAADHY